MTDILQLKGWKALKSTIGNGEQVIEAEYSVPPTSCTKCGVIGNLLKHGPKPTYIRDSPIRGMPVRILANAQRYKCRECGGTFIQPLGGVRDAMRMTDRCAKHIEANCLVDTFQRISDHVGCDEKTIRNIAGDYIERLNSQYRPWLPEWLGIDETQIDGKLRCIITDVANRVPIDMLPDRDKPLVTSWLYQFKDRRTVKGLAIDMWRPYKDAAQAVFPGLPVVIDKFHVVKMANKAMDDVRVVLAKDQSKAVGRDWMRRKSLLRMRYKGLDERGRFNLQMWLDNEPEVAVAYWLKESFYDIYDAPNKAAAGDRLDAWRKSVPAHMKKGKKSFAPLLTATRNWREEILAFFDHPISNGYTEALNGVAKVINRSGRGYSFDVLRARLLFKNGVTGQPALKLITAYPPSEAMAKLLIGDEGARCESCDGIFDRSELMVAFVAPVGRKVVRRQSWICKTCFRRIHTESANAHKSASTP